MVDITADGSLGWIKLGLLLVMGRISLIENRVSDFSYFHNQATTLFNQLHHNNTPLPDKTFFDGFPQLMWNGE